jgi:hypothetical protein
MDMLLFDLVDSLQSKKINFAIVGGYALALQGLVRSTVDIDIVLSLNLNDFRNAELALKEIGLVSRIPVRAQDVISMREEFIEKKNLIAWSFVDCDDPSRQVDIIITEELKALKTKLISVGPRKIPVATLEELLRMKTKSGRPQDLVDIQNIRERFNGKKNKK